MPEETKLVIVGLGWGVQALTWLAAMARLRAAAATRAEWAPELAVRAGVLLLAVWSLLAPPLIRVALPAAGLIGASLVCVAGHAAASLGRLQLGGSWGIGTAYRPDRNRVVGRGIYRYVPHPIYLGTGVAVAAQVVLLGNLPSVILLAGAVIISPWKAAREKRWIDRMSVKE